MKRKFPPNGYYRLRYQILERDEFTCQGCGQYAPNVMLEVDHIVPVAEGGTDVETNLRTYCWACNRGRSGLRESMILAGKRQQARQARGHSLEIPTHEPTLTERIFNLIQSGGEIHTRDVAKALICTEGTARGILNRLKGRGLVERRGVFWGER